MELYSGLIHNGDKIKSEPIPHIHNMYGIDRLICGKNLECFITHAMVVSADQSARKCRNYRNSTCFSQMKRKRYISGSERIRLGNDVVMPKMQMCLCDFLFFLKCRVFVFGLGHPESLPMTNRETQK